LTDLIDRTLTENGLKFAASNATTYGLMLSYPFEPEEENILDELDPEEDFYPEETFGDRLRLFYAQFSSGTRSLLSDSLFREIQTGGVLQGLEILCPNEIVQRRLVNKQQKICNEVRWIWPDSINQVEIWVKRLPGSRKTLRVRS
jgi:hypothetical protein